MPYQVFVAGEEGVSYSTDIFSVSGLCEVSGLNGFALGRLEDGTAVAYLGDENDDGQAAVSTWSGLIQIASGGLHSVGLKSDGTIVAAGNDYYSQCTTPMTWTGVSKIAAGLRHTVAIKTDGTCVAAGWNNYGQCNVTGWTDIVEIAASAYHTVGLKSDGTCVATGLNTWGECNITGWANVESITTGTNSTSGSLSNGTCVRVGRDNTDLAAWTGVTKVRSFGYETVGLKSNGAALSTFTSAEVAGWTGLTDIQYSADVAVGLIYTPASTPHEYEGGCLIPFSGSGVVSKRIITPRSVTGRLRLWSHDRLTLYMETSAFNSLQIVRRFVGNCTLEAYFPAYSEEAYYILEGGWVEDDEGEWYRIHYRRATKDFVQLIAYGPHKVLGQRITVPASGVYGISVTGSADSVIKSLISQTIANAGRDLPILVASVRSGGTTISEISRYKNLGEEVERICYANDLGESFTFSATDFIFDTYAGTDRTRENTAGNAPAIFSVRYDNLEDWSHAIASTDEVTTVYVAGQGTGTTRTLVIVGASETGEGRFEQFRDARDTNSAAILASRGAEAIFPPAESFSAKANTSGNLTYNTDYALGDLVTIEIPERTAIYNASTGLWEKVERYRSEDKRITEIVRTYEGGAMDIDLVFGEAPKTRGDKQSEVQSNLSRLEAI